MINARLALDDRGVSPSEINTVEGGEGRNVRVRKEETGAIGFDDSGPKSSGPRDRFVSATWYHDHMGSRLSQEAGGILIADIYMRDHTKLTRKTTNAFNHGCHVMSNSVS